MTVILLVSHLVEEYFADIFYISYILTSIDMTIAPTLKYLYSANNNEMIFYFISMILYVKLHSFYIFINIISLELFVFLRFCAQWMRYFLKTKLHIKENIIY